MESWQKIFIFTFGLSNLIIFFKGFYMCKNKRAAYTLTPRLTVLGIFAWGDAVVFGLFWTLVSITVLLLNNFILFCLTFSVFWFVRSLGETIYWFNQQFAQKVYMWNEPKNLKLHWLFHDDSVWYVYQISWQCVSIISIIVSIYFGSLWIQKFLI